MHLDSSADMTLTSPTCADPAVPVDADQEPTSSAPQAHVTSDLHDSNELHIDAARPIDQYPSCNPAVNGADLAEVSGADLPTVCAESHADAGNSPLVLTEDFAQQILRYLEMTDVPPGLAPDSFTSDLIQRFIDIVANAMIMHRNFEQTSICFMQDINKRQDGLETQLERAKDEQSRLRKAVEAMDLERERSQLEFYKWKKRANQQELVQQVQEVEGQIAKLRAPDVTLEQVKASVASFEGRLCTQDKKVDWFQARCQKELERLANSRKQFNRDVRSRKRDKKDDMADLQNVVSDLATDILWIKDRLNVYDQATSRAFLSEDANSTASALAKLDADVTQTTAEIRVFRQHMQGVIQDDGDFQELAAASVKNLQKSVDQIRHALGGQQAMLDKLAQGYRETV